MAAPAPSSESNTPKKRIPWLFRHWGLTIFVLIVVLGILGLILLTPAKKAWKQRQAIGYLAKAEAFMADRNWSEAAPMLEKAFLASPKDPAIVRACANYERDAVKNPDATGYYLKLLIDMKAANSEDRAVMGEALLAQGKLDKAREMYESIALADRKSKAVLQLESELIRKEGDSVKANDLLRKSLSITADETNSKLKLALLDAESPLEELQQRSLDTLWEIARSNAPEAVTAIERIAFHPLLNIPQSADLLELVTKRADSSRKLRFIALSAYLRLHPLEREIQLDKLTALSADKSDEELAELCQWLLSLGETGRVLKLLPKDKALKNPKLLSSYMDALLNSQSWKEITDIVQNTRGLPLSPLNVAQLLARSAYALGEPPAVVRTHLEQAKQFAVTSKDSFGLDKLSSIADSIGYPDVAISCLQSVTATSQQQKENLASRILDLQRRIGDLPGMLATLDAMNSSQNRSNDHVEAFIYIKLISGIELETIMDDCDKFAQQGRISPNAHHFLRALSAYRNGELTNLSKDLALVKAADLQVHWRGVMAGLLAVSGKHAEAFQIAEKINQAILTPEEALIYREAL
jgi:tetratricopeptide (TPR) repeat protein